jgi:hypothetical protein
MLPALLSIAARVVIIPLLVLTSLVALEAPSDALRPPDRQEGCMEDEPCFDCRHMGNRDCGPDHKGKHHPHTPPGWRKGVR